MASASLKHLLTASINQCQACVHTLCITVLLRLLVSSSSWLVISSSSWLMISSSSWCHHAHRVYLHSSVSEIRPVKLHRGFSNPSRSGTAVMIPTASQATMEPLHDPAALDALVMPRPSQRHQVRSLSGVVLGWI